MKITSEKAFDMLPYVVDIYEKLDIQNFAQGKKQNLEGKTKEEIAALQRAIGQDFVKYIIRNAPKIKDEFFYIVSIVQDKDLEAVKNQNFLETVKAIKSVFEDKELMSFFSSAMR